MTVSADRDSELIQKQAEIWNAAVETQAKVDAAALQDGDAKVGAQSEDVENEQLSDDGTDEETRLMDGILEQEAFDQETSQDAQEANAELVAAEEDSQIVEDGS